MIHGFRGTGLFPSLMLPARTSRRQPGKQYGGVVIIVRGRIPYKRCMQKVPGSTTSPGMAAANGLSTRLLVQHGTKRLASAKVHLIAPVQPGDRLGSASRYANIVQRRLKQCDFSSSGCKVTVSLRAVTTAQHSEPVGFCRSVIVNAKPSARLPERTVKVLCAGCKEPLYKVLFSQRTCV